MYGSTRALNTHLAADQFAGSAIADPTAAVVFAALHSEAHIAGVGILRSMAPPVAS